VKKIARLLFVVLITLLVASLGINTWLSKTARANLYSDISTIPYNQYALLLGTAKYDDAGEIHTYYYTRVRAALDLYKAGKVSGILVSSNNDKFKNAETMRVDLIASGVPAHDILLDTLGLRTINSIERCKNVFNIHDITIVSQEKHCERALYMARYKGLSAIAYAAPDKHKPFAIGVMYHEQVARFVMLYDLYL
jgi:SanA protein